MVSQLIEHSRLPASRSWLWTSFQLASPLQWPLFLQVVDALVFLLCLSMVAFRPYGLVQGNFSTFLTLWELQFATSSRNTCLYHIHGLGGHDSICFLFRLLGSSFIFLGHFKDGSSLICINTWSSVGIQGSVVGVSSQGRPCLPVVLIHFLPCLGLLWTKALFQMMYIISFHSFNFLLLLGHNNVLSVYEALS